MEIDITSFVREHRDHMERFSDSVANSGLENIGQITWRNAMEYAGDWLTQDLDALRDHFRGYGAWSRAELDAMSGHELNALLIQFIAGDYQERARAEERGDLEYHEQNFGGRLIALENDEWLYHIGD